MTIVTLIGTNLPRRCKVVFLAYRSMERYEGDLSLEIWQTMIRNPPPSSRLCPQLAPRRHTAFLRRLQLHPQLYPAWLLLSMSVDTPRYTHSVCASLWRCHADPSQQSKQSTTRSSSSKVVLIWPLSSATELIERTQIPDSRIAFTHDA